MIHQDSITRKVLEYIRSNPGTTRSRVLEVLPDGTKRNAVSSILGHLAHGGAIENRGRSGLAARWFPVEITVDFVYRTIASDLLKELKAIHHSQKEDYLAKRLQEIFD